jgi:putative transposase
VLEATNASWANPIEARSGPCARRHVLAVIEHAIRRIRVLGATPHPTASWASHAARNPRHESPECRCRARFLIRDRRGKFPDLVDAILDDAGIEIVHSGVQMPRMNVIVERWVQTRRRRPARPEPDQEPAAPDARTARVRAVPQRPQASPGSRKRAATARAADADPEPLPATRLHIRRRDRLGGTLHESRYAARPPRISTSDCCYLALWRARNLCRL